MLNNSKRSRRFMLPAAVATAFAVAFVTLPIAVADEPAATKTVVPSIPSETHSQKQIENSAAPAVSSTEIPSSEAPTVESGSAPSIPAVIETAAPKVVANPTPGDTASFSPSALPTPSATFSERILKLQSADVGRAIAPLAALPIDKARLIVKAGGDRTDGTNVSPLAGARFNFFKTNDDVLDGGSLVDSCTTSSDGMCDVTVQLGTKVDGKTTKTNYFYAKQDLAPNGWSIAGSWGGANEFIRYATGAITQTGNENSRTKTLPGANRTWPAVRKNIKKEVQQCGVKMAVVFDLSWSVTSKSDLMAQYKKAGTSFVTALENTPSQISLKTFASRSPAKDNKNTPASNSQTGLISVAQTTGADSLRNTISNFTGVNSPYYFTNWDKGLAQTDNDYDVLLFLTDGDPTTFGDGSHKTSGQGTSPDIRTVEEAIHSANQAKANGTQVIAVGIGNDMNQADNEQRLKLISGPDKNKDYFITGFNNLGEQLKALAAKDCNGTVTVRKEVELPNGDRIPGTDWEFSAPAGTGVTTGTGTAVSGKTNATGAMNFRVGGYTPGIASRSVTITESQQPGYKLLQQEQVNATCSSKNSDKAVAVKNDKTLGFTVDVPEDDTIICLVINKKLPASISIDKTAQGITGGASANNPANIISGATVTWTYTVTNTGEVPLSGIIVVDDKILGPLDCKNVTTLAPEASMICTATGLVTAQPISKP